MKKPRLRVPQVHIIEDQPAVVAPKPAPRARISREKLLIRVGVLMPFVLLAFTLARGAAEHKYLPTPLLGVWETSDEHYADCYMEITPATVLFGNAEKGYIMFFVSSIEEDRQGGATSYLVHYTDLDGVKYHMSIVYRPGPHESLFFSHQAGVLWTRRPSV